MLPNFIIAGGKKCGTTSAFSVLRSHPEVFVPGQKEVHFFDRKNEYKKGIERYKKYFRSWKDEKAILDITPNYMYIPGLPERIKKMVPDVKLIFILRDPVKRAYSHYWHSVRDQMEKESFDKAIKTNHVYINKSLYSQHIKRFLKYFDKDKIKIFISEEMFEKSDCFYKEFFNFLGISMYPEINLKKKENFARLPKYRTLKKIFISQNMIFRYGRKLVPRSLKNNIIKLDEKINMKKISPPPIKEETKKYLKGVFYNDIREIENIFNVDLNSWLR